MPEKFHSVHCIETLYIAALVLHNKNILFFLSYFYRMIVRCIGINILQVEKKLDIRKSKKKTVYVECLYDTKGFMIEKSAFI